MHIFASVLLAAFAASDALASPIQARSPYVVKETHFVPKEWTKLERAHGGKTIQLQIGLKQGKFEELDRHLHEGTSAQFPSFGLSRCLKRIPELTHKSL
jgi:tripeptidyl-peptidase-1